MRLKAIRKFAIRAKGEQFIFEPGEIFDMETEKASRLVEAGVVEHEPLPDHVIPWFTKTGREIYLITSERIRQSAPTGKAVFSLSEIEQMRGLPDEQIEAIITTKESFPGAIVEL